MAVGRWVWRALRWSGAPYLMRQSLQRRGVTVLCYHDPDPAVLYDHLAALGKRYALVGLRDYVRARLGGDMSSLPDRALVVTLDDGHSGNVRLTDVFRRHRVRPTVFLASGIVDTDRDFWWRHVRDGRSETEQLMMASGPEGASELERSGILAARDSAGRSALSRDEIEAMAPSIDFQSHTVTHPILARCSDERAHTEVFQSKSDLEARYGLVVYALAYPNGASGDWGQREVDLAVRAGYRCALSAIPGVNHRDTDPFAMRRIVIPDDASCDELLVRASLLHNLLRRVVPTAVQ